MKINQVYINDTVIKKKYNIHVIYPELFSMKINQFVNYQPQLQVLYRSIS
jgi:hypothetical protein